MVYQQNPNIPGYNLHFPGLRNLHFLGLDFPHLARNPHSPGFEHTGYRPADCYLAGYIPADCCLAGYIPAGTLFDLISCWLSPSLVIALLVITLLVVALLILSILAIFSIIILLLVLISTFLAFVSLLILRVRFVIITVFTRIIRKFITSSIIVRWG